MRPLILVSILLSTGVAHAEPDVVAAARTLAGLRSLEFGLADLEALRDFPRELENVYGQLLYDPVVGPLVANIGDQYRGGFWRIDAGAGAATATDVPAAVTATVDASYELPLCRVIGAAASGELGYADDDPLAAWSATGSACLPLPANTVWVAYTHADNVYGSLFSRASTLRERRSNDIYDIHLRFYRYRGTTHEVSVMPMSFLLDHVHGTSVPGTWNFDLTAAPVRWATRSRGLLGRDRTFSFVEIKAQDVSDDDSSRSASVVYVSPVHLENQRVSDTVAFSADAGYAVASSYDRDSPIIGVDDQGQPLRASLVEEHTVYGDLELAAAVGPTYATVRATHGMVPILDGQIVRDDRISASLMYANAPFSGRADGFLARQEVLRDLPGGRVANVGGGAIEAAWAATEHIFVVTRAEAGRTLTAARATDPVATEWDVRATLGVQAQLSARSSSP